mgnify:CR=1 FL=1
MANWYEPTQQQVSDWAAWVAERPEGVRLVAEQFFPWKLYRLTGTDQRVTIQAFGENDNGPVTVRVAVRAKFNFVSFERDVFGIAPSDLVECDLPEPSERLGVANRDSLLSWEKA